MTIYSAAITLILVMDPLGNIPLFLSILKNVPPERWRFIIFRESLIAFFILATFLLFGQYILDGMHISQPALAISGGIILFLIAIRMIFPHSEVEKGAHRQSGEPFIVPLAVPLIAGPSTMTMVMLFAHQAPFETFRWFLALVFACFVTGTVLIFASTLRKLLGERGLIAIERLMGMILTTMAVQLTLSGLEQFIHT